MASFLVCGARNKTEAILICYRNITLHVLSYISRSNGNAERHNKEFLILHVCSIQYDK